MTVSNFTRSMLVTALAALAFPPIEGARAQADPAATYPAKTVRVLVGYAAGGGMDFPARLYADRRRARPRIW